MKHIININNGNTIKQCYRVIFTKNKILVSDRNGFSKKAFRTWGDFVNYVCGISGKIDLLKI